MHPESSQKALVKDTEFPSQDLGWPRLEVSLQLGKEEVARETEEEVETIVYTWHFLPWKFSNRGFVWSLLTPSLLRKAKLQGKERINHRDLKMLKQRSSPFSEPGWPWLAHTPLNNQAQSGTTKFGGKTGTGGILLSSGISAFGNIMIFKIWGRGLCDLWLINRNSFSGLL